MFVVSLVGTTRRWVEAWDPVDRGNEIPYLMHIDLFFWRFAFCACLFLFLLGVLWTWCLVVVWFYLLCMLCV